MASIAFCASLCKPSREIVKAGNATTVFCFVDAFGDDRHSLLQRRLV